MLITSGSALYYLVLFLILGNLFALLIGVMMLVAPQQLANLSKAANRWISTRQMTRPLDVPHPTDRAMLRYPRLLGAILLGSAAIILVKGAVFISNLSVTDGGKLLERFYSGVSFSSATWETLWLGIVIMIILGAVLAAGVGLMSLFRVGRLRDWAGAINRWISTRQLTRPLDVPRYAVDRLAHEKPRVWGGVICALALYSIFVLWWFGLRA